MVRPFLDQDRVPLFPKCGDVRLKHATISFGQQLDERVLDEAIEPTRNTNLFIALGSSLVVEPAASLPRLAKQSGARLVVIQSKPDSA